MQNLMVTGFFIAISNILLQMVLLYVDPTVDACILKLNVLIQKLTNISTVLVSRFCQFLPDKTGSKPAPDKFNIK